jgi:ABC-2 type transport system permease protein
MLDAASVLGQTRRSLAIARKDIRLYYSKGPVVIFGILFPVFLFLSFSIGRNLTVDSMIPGLLGMILFFTATAISPIVIPWEAQARTLERLMSSPVKTETIILGDILASTAFGMVISLVAIVFGLGMGVQISNVLVFSVAVILSALCFASLGSVFSAPPTSMPSTVNMIASVVKFPVIFISGVFIPLAELPTWGQAIAYISPLTYFTDIARISMQGQGHLPIAADLLALLAFTLLFCFAALKLHRRTMPRRI